jgi:DNA modification methylase
VTFRKWAEGMDETAAIEKLPGLWHEWSGEGKQFVHRRTPEGVELPDYASLSITEQKRDPRYFEALDIWQNWASPVWMDTNETNVLNAKVARDEDAEKHLCPMPLDLTERCIRLWSNEGDVVLSPFGGIGSEGYVAIKARRKFLGIELNPSYWAQGVKNLKEAEANAGNLFAGVAA